MKNNSKINVLEKLDTLGVSLVKRGANRKQFSITKSEGYMDLEEIESLQNIIADYVCTNEEEVDEVMKSEHESSKSAVKAIMRILEAHKDVLPKDLMKKLSMLSGYSEEDKKDMEEQQQEEVSMSKKEDVVEDIKEESKEDIKKGELDLSSVPEALRAQVEQLWKSNQEAVKKAEFLESVLKEEQDKNLTAEFIAKSKENYSDLPESVENIASILKTAYGHSEELGSNLEKLFKSVSAIISKSSMFDEISTSYGASEGTPEHELTALAKSIVQKSSNTVSFAEAYDKVISENPELYSRYLSENPSQVQ